MVLDVPELEVDRITLEVRDLKAHVSILAELAESARTSRSASTPGSTRSSWR